MRPVAAILAAAIFLMPSQSPASEGALTFDQTRVCLDVANAIEDLQWSADALRPFLSDGNANARDLTRVAGEVERTAFRLYRISRDSTHLVPWSAVDEFAEDQRFSGGYESGAAIWPKASRIHAEVNQLRLAAEWSAYVDIQRATEIMEQIQAIGAPSKIREICGKIFLGKK